MVAEDFHPHTHWSAITVLGVEEEKAMNDR